METTDVIQKCNLVRKQDQSSSKQLRQNVNSKILSQNFCCSRQNFRAKHLNSRQICPLVRYLDLNIFSKLFSDSSTSDSNTSRKDERVNLKPSCHHVNRNIQRINIELIWTDVSLKLSRLGPQTIYILPLPPPLLCLPTCRAETREGGREFNLQKFYPFLKAAHTSILNKNVLF